MNNLNIRSSCLRDNTGTVKVLLNNDYQFFTSSVQSIVLTLSHPGKSHKSGGTKITSEPYGNFI